MKNYEILDHTADIRIKIKSLTLKGLFRNACRAIASIAAEKQKFLYPQSEKYVITQKADNLEELLVNWINELLSVSAAQGLVFEDVKINFINDRLVDAEALGFDARNYRMNAEIKAATYHDLKVEKKGLFWEAQVILDV